MRQTNIVVADTTRQTSFIRGQPFIGNQEIITGREVASPEKYNGFGTYADNDTQWNGNLVGPGAVGAAHLWRKNLHRINGKIFK